MPINYKYKNHICAIIVTYNIGDVFIRNFNSIKNQVKDIIIIDNGSHENTLQILKGIELTNKDNLIIKYNSTNLGLSKAQNIGIKIALEKGYEWVLLLDHDSSPTPGMVKEMLLAYDKNPDPTTGIIVPYLEEINVKKNYYVILPFLHIFFKKYPLSGKTYINNILYAAASGSLIKTELIKDIGLMNEEFFIDYIDLEYCLRARDRGWNIMASGKALLNHQMANMSEHSFLGLKITTGNNGRFRRYTISYAQVLCWRLYGNKFPSSLTHILVCVIVQLFKIIIFEEDKLANLKAMLHGWSDGFKKTFSKDGGK